MTAAALIVKAYYGSVTKSWIWDARKPLRLRRPWPGVLERKGRELFFTAHDGEPVRIGAWGQAVEHLPYQGTLLKVEPRVTSQKLLTIDDKVPGEGLRIALTLLVVLAVGGLLFQRYLNSPVVPPMAFPAPAGVEVTVKTLPSRVSLPVAPIPVQPEKKWAQMPETGSGSPGGGGRVGKRLGTEGGKGFGSGSGNAVASRKLKQTDALLKDVFGGLGVGDGAKGVAKGGRSRFGFGAPGAGQRRAGEVDAEGEAGSEQGIGAVASASSVRKQLTDKYSPEIETGPGARGEGVGFGAEGAGSLARVEGQGSSPILFEASALKVGDGLTYQEVQKVIQKRISEVRRCHDVASRSGKAFEGKLFVSFLIRRNGSPSNLKFEGNDSMEASLSQCLEKKVLSWQFASPRGGREVEVRYPFVFMTLKGDGQ